MTTDSFDRLRGLTARLLGLLTFALFPLALISLYQTQTVVDEAETLSRTALLAETNRAVAQERELIQLALGAGEALGASVQTVGQYTAACRDLMQSFVERSTAFVFAGFIDKSGLMTCASRGDPIDFSSGEGWAEAVGDIRNRIQSTPKGAVTGKPVLIASHPVIGPTGFAGYTSISIPHDLANYLLPETSEFGAFTIATIQPNGEVLSASSESASEDMPADLAPTELFARAGDVFNANSMTGEKRKYAVIPVFDGAVHAVGSWPISASQSRFLSGNTAAPLAFPLLMWLVGIAVAWLGLHNLVIRHVRSLRDAMRRFALGERNAPQLALPNPPEELAEAERAFNRMVAILSETEERRESDLHDKTVLLREVHHRVKNNLQLIASITNMQMRQVKTPEARGVLAQLQRRVRGLATIHQSIYITPDMTTVDARELIETMVAQMDQVGGRTAAAPRIKTELRSVMLYPDQAVPLSMLMAEALNNAWKYAHRDDGKRPDLLIQFGATPDGRAELIVENSRSDEDRDSDGDAVEHTGLGTRLMQAFVSQLEGESDVTETSTQYRLRVTFQPAQFDTDAIA